MFIRLKPQNTDDCDKFGSAEIPDKNLYPKAYAVVVNQMVHGPCGSQYPNAPCMKVDPKTNIKRCSKHDPKQFQNATEMTEDGYPIYRRRNTHGVV